MHNCVFPLLCAVFTQCTARYSPYCKNFERRKQGLSVPILKSRLSRHRLSANSSRMESGLKELSTWRRIAINSFWGEVWLLQPLVLVYSLSNLFILFSSSKLIFLKLKIFGALLLRYLTRQFNLFNNLVIVKNMIKINLARGYKWSLKYSLMVIYLKHLELEVEL